MEAEDSSLTGLCRNTNIKGGTAVRRENRLTYKNIEERGFTDLVVECEKQGKTPGVTFQVV